jgi:hypothetical protein
MEARLSHIQIFAVFCPSAATSSRKGLRQWMPIWMLSKNPLTAGPSKTVSDYPQILWITPVDNCVNPVDNSRFLWINWKIFSIYSQ